MKSNRILALFASLFALALITGCATETPAPETKNDAVPKSIEAGGKFQQAPTE